MKKIDDPIHFYPGLGMCEKLAQSIWGKTILQRSDRSQFSNYTQQIDKEIGYQCVTMARFDWGVLFIDLCDGSDWEIPQIDESHIYLKNAI